MIKAVLYAEVLKEVTDDVGVMTFLTVQAEKEAASLGRTIGPPTVGSSDQGDHFRVVVWEINPAS